VDLVNGLSGIFYFMKLKRVFVPVYVILINAGLLQQTDMLLALENQFCLSRISPL